MAIYEIDGVVPVIDATAFVHPDAVLIGDVIIGPGCYIGPLASLRADLGRIIVGANSNVQGTVVSCTVSRVVTSLWREKAISGTGQSCTAARSARERWLA